MRFEKKIETVDIFRIQVKMSIFVQFQLNIDENNLKVTNVLRKIKILDNYFANFENCEKL